MAINAEEVIRLIRDYAGRSDHVFVNFSGGKYSLVLLHLALRALREVKALYVDTTITLPECNEYVKGLCQDWGVELVIVRREDIDFWGLVKRKGFPTPRLRWCMKELKFIPLKLLNKSVGGNCLHLTGTTMSESSKRREVYSIRGAYYLNYIIGSYVLQPILTWNEKIVNKYIEKHRLPVNPCYSLYGNEGNCYYCPHIKSREYYLKLAKTHPKLFSNIVEAEKNLRSGGAAIYLGKGKLLYLSRLFSEESSAIARKSSKSGGS